MAGLFTELFNRLKWSKDDTVNLPFKMYSRVTVGLFLVASVASVAKDWGDPIVCTGGDDIAEPYCLTHGASHTKITDCTNQKLETLGEGDLVDTKHTEYYLWVSLMLFIHGATFMIPNMLWKYLEG